MITSQADDTKRENTPLVLGRTASTTSSAGSSVHSGFLLARRVEYVLVRVLLMLQLPLRAFPMVPITSSMHFVPRKQKYLPRTSPDRSVRLSLKDLRVMKRDT